MYLREHNQNSFISNFKITAMKRFILRILLVISLFILINALLLFAIPIDKNAYLCEYNEKVSMLENVQQPRVIFIGGSNLAFGLNSEAIHDSLDINVVNFGLHAGIGIRYTMDDCLQYLKPNDIVVIQMEYTNFFESSNGEPETLAPLMVITGWRNFWKMNNEQKKIVFKGLPQVGFGNIKRLIMYLSTKTWDSEPSSAEFEYRKSGFNKYGDEVSHYNYQKEQLAASNGQVQTGEINKDFVKWLKETLNAYKAKGCKIIMMPPACTHSVFLLKYREDIGICLNTIGYPYIVDPNEATLDDSMSFNKGYHLNKVGAIANTNRIIRILNKNKR